MKPKHRLAILVSSGFLAAILAVQFLPVPNQSNPAPFALASVAPIFQANDFQETLLLNVQAVVRTIEERPRQIVDGNQYWYLQPDARGRVLAPGLHPGYTLDLLDTRSLLIAE